MKLSDNLEKFKSKISTNKKRNAEDLFKIADAVMGIDDDESQEDESQEKENKLVRKSYTIPVKELKYIEKIKEKALKKMLIWNDSEVLRISLSIASELPFIALEEGFSKLEKVRVGRPIKKRSKKKLKLFNQE